MALVASVLLPVLVFAAGAWIGYGRHTEEATERLERGAEVLREHTAKVFETADLLATFVDEMLRGLDDAQIRRAEEVFHQRLAELRAGLPQIQDVWVLDRDGVPLFAANVYPMPRELDLSDREYYRVHEKGARRATFVSEVLAGRVQDVVFFQVSRPRFSADDRFAGVIAISILPGYFTEVYGKLSAEGHLAAALLREDGALLARYPAIRDLQLTRSAGFAKQVAAAPHGGVFVGRSSVNGVERIAAYRKVGELPVYVVTALPVAEVQAAWLADMADLAIFAVPATIGFFVLTLLLTRRTAEQSAALVRLGEEIRRRELVEAQLRQSAKMDAIGRLTGGLAHDFNNMLTAIGGNLEMVLKRLPEDAERPRRSAAGALEAVRRAAELTQRLLAFSRQQPLEPRVLDLNRVVQRTSVLLARTLGEPIRIETVLAAGLWPTLADANQVETALLNLAINARDAMPDGGRLTIETANAHLDDAYIAAQGLVDLEPGQYVYLAVSDTGVGMAEETIAKAFEPFFTTKPPGQGTGLGLSQVYGFARQSGGHVRIYSEPGHGTTVRMYLPRHRAAHAAAEELERSTVGDDVAGGTEAILAVEDDRDVLEFTAEVLRDAGYAVIEAGDGPAALAALDAHPEVALLFTDVVLPGGMNGRQIADRACERRPDLRVLFTSGYTRNAIVHHGRLDPDVELVSKPFTSTELLRKVRRVLDRPAG